MKIKTNTMNLKEMNKELLVDGVYSYVVNF